MKLHRVALLASFAAAPAFAAPIGFLLDFEKTWDYANGDVAAYYAGGTAADGTTGTNRGVSFTNVSGLSNDASFAYYSGAPSPQGTAYAHTFAAGDTAFMNIVGGSVGNALSFYYSTPTAIVGAIRAWSGLNGTGTLLGTFDLAANSADYSAWTDATFRYTGYAQSFDLTNAANVVLLDNVRATAVPEPEVLALLLAGGMAIFTARGRRRPRVGRSDA